jgi:predicted Zn-dependent protease
MIIADLEENKVEYVLATPFFYEHVRQLGGVRRKRRRSTGYVVAALVVLVLGAAGLYSIHGYWDGREPSSPLAKTNESGPLDTFLALEQALRREPHRRDYRQRAAEAASRLKRFDDARDHLLILVKESPTDGPLQQDLGKAYEGTGEYDKAALAYAEATKHAPDQLQSYIQGASVLRKRLERPTDADQVMAALVANNPQLAKARLARANYRREFRLAGVDEDVQRALDLAPHDADVLLAAADLAWEHGDTPERRKHLEHGIDLYAGDQRFLQSLIKLEVQEHRLEKAIFWAHRLVEVRQDKDWQSAEWTLGNLLLEAHRPEESRQLLNELRAAAYEPAMVDYLEARVLMDEGAWREAACDRRVTVFFGKIRTRSAPPRQPSFLGNPSRLP